MRSGVDTYMELKDARKIDHEELYDRRKQAIMLFKKQTMNRGQIAEIVGVRRDVVGKWIKIWQEGGVRALKPNRRGRPYGTGKTLTPDQEKAIQKCLVEKHPDQYKMDFALWNRPAVQQLKGKKGTVPL